MKKWLKIILRVIIIIVLIIVIDLVCIFTINRPIFSQGEDHGTYAVYKGLFFNTYVCSEFSTPQIKVKRAKYTCAVLEIDEENDNNEGHYFLAKVIEVHDNSIIIEPANGTDERKSSDKIIIKRINNDVYVVGDKIKVTYNGLIEESYPAQISANEIEIIK